MTILYLTFQDRCGPYTKTLFALFWTYSDEMYICGFMRHIQVKPVCDTAGAVQMVQLCVWHSKHTGRHLCRTLQLIGWEANMDYSTVKLEDLYEMD